MTTYKGNAGHLMQHWTLCELLRIAAYKGVTGLNFIDAYAMAPLATENPGKDTKFQNAENRLPNLGKAASAYERAWHKLTAGHHPPKGYPNSAAFVEQVWKGDFSMLLCETDQPTIDEIKPWLQRVDKLERCKATELFCRDWLERFKKGLPSPTDARLAESALTLVLFDPDMYNRNWRKRDPRKLYSYDLETATRAMDGLAGGVLIQLSTYSAQDDNSQRDVVPSVNGILGSSGFKLLEKMRIDGNMMSLVYERNVSWAAELADILGGFDKWFSAI